MQVAIPWHPSNISTPASELKTALLSAAAPAWQADEQNLSSLAEAPSILAPSQPSVVAIQIKDAAGRLRRLRAQLQSVTGMEQALSDTLSAAGSTQQLSHPDARPPKDLTLTDMGWRENVRGQTGIAVKTNDVQASNSSTGMNSPGQNQALVRRGNVPTSSDYQTFETPRQNYSDSVPNVNSSRNSVKTEGVRKAAALKGQLW
jgi:hypothetical protein